MVQTLMYGVPSGCSFGSIVALEWLEEPYRLCRIEMPVDVQSEAYRQINPVGETPTLTTATGERISESMAILHHLGARGIGKGLSFAQGTPEFDRFNRVLAFLNTSFFTAFDPLWYVFEHGLEGPEKDALRAYGAAKVTKAYGDLEPCSETRTGCWATGPRWPMPTSPASRGGPTVTLDTLKMRVTVDFATETGISHTHPSWLPLTHLRHPGLVPAGAFPPPLAVYRGSAPDLHAYGSTICRPASSSLKQPPQAQRYLYWDSRGT